MLSSSENNIIRCAPLHSTTFATKIDKIESLTSIQKSFFNKFPHCICPQDNIPKILTSFLDNNIPSNHSPLHELELLSITSGYPIGQFIADIYCQCVIHYNWTINEFIEKTALFSNIPKHNKAITLIRSYLKQYLKLVSMPINIQLPQSDNYSVIDDDEVDNTIQSNHLIPFIKSKHNMRKILYYLSQFNFSLCTMRSQQQRKIFRQIDAIFIPNSPQINDELLTSKGIKYTELNMDRLSRISRCIVELTGKDYFSRCVMLISGEKLYLFKIAMNNAMNAWTDILDYSELPWINNTRHNDRKWLKDIVQKYNGITFSYHIHSNDIQRVYCSYESIDNKYYSMRVFKHNIVNILKIFCNEIENDIDDTVIDEIEFNDVQYDAFVNTYFSDLKFESIQKKIDETKCVPGGYNYRGEGTVPMIIHDENNNVKNDNFNVKSLYRIPRKLTQKISNMILDSINDVYKFMIDKLCFLSVNNGIYQLANGDRIINFGFRHKITNDILYTYANKIDPAMNRNFEWSFNDRVYTAANIKHKYAINDRQLPQLNDFNINNIPKLMNKDIKLLIANTKWSKINVYNDSKVNKQMNKRKLTLTLTSEHFKNNLLKYLHSYGNNDVHLIPILTLNKNKKYYTEYVWIVSIESDVDIGISFKWQSDCKTVTGIYINKQILLRHHMLLNLHECHCLDGKFLSKITCLRIGNVREGENKVKDLRKRNKKIKTENNDLQNVFSDLRVKMSNMKQELETLKAIALKKHQSYTNQNNINEIGETTLFDEGKLSNPMQSNISLSALQTVSIPQYMYSFNGINIVPMIEGNNLPNMLSFNSLPTNLYFTAPMNAKINQ